MAVARILQRLRVDRFTLALLATVLLASLLPVQGPAVRWLDAATSAAIALLFFLHGARLPREALVAGLLHWRLHITIVAATFVLFPLLGLALRPLSGTLLTPELYVGVLFLCALPSTVQSSIAFTAMAGGNVAAAVCAASASSLLGVVLTPLLMALMVGAHGAGGDPLGAIGEIMLLLLVPFVAGHLLRPWLRPWLERSAGVLRYTDQGTILLVVYVAFSASVAEGLWRETPVSSLLVLTLVACLLLAVVMTLLTIGARRLGFARADEIAIVFCGSKKSLATGAPMAKILFAGGGLGAVVLPIMLFHQIQLVVCAILAQRYARTAPAAAGKG